MKTILIILGTRPEAIKLAPVAGELRQREGVTPLICVTGQHREMLQQVMSSFDLKADFDLDLMMPNQSLFGLTSRVLSQLEQVLQESRPDMVIVQGDTTTAMATALAAYYSQIPLAHVEAGLRTGDKYRPFPEEGNRVIIDLLADLNFPPTIQAKENLVRMGVPEEIIHVTGNTVIDSLHQTMQKIDAAYAAGEKACYLPAELPEDLITRLDRKPPAIPTRMVLVTGHRRESFGTSMESMCQGLKNLATRNAEIEIVYPVHMNPSVSEPVNRILGDVDRIHLINPLNYEQFVWLLSRSYLILTDSGGVQEEGPALGKPVLVMRETTERPEGVESGSALVVGVESDTIVSSAESLLNNPSIYDAMAAKNSTYGDGKAAVRVVDAIMDWLVKSA